MNIERRKVSRNAFEKDYVKLMKNSIFGKTLEIVRGDAAALQSVKRG